MKSKLDNAMARFARPTVDQLSELRSLFLNSLELAHAIGGTNVFRLPPTLHGSRGRPSASLYDGIMVALMRMSDRAENIRVAAPEIHKALQAELERPEFRKIIVGQPNTKAATVERSTYVEEVILGVLKPM